MAIIVMPCSDTLLGDHFIQELMDYPSANHDDHGHDHDQDACSPLCFCHCCHTHITIQTNLMNEVIAEAPLSVGVPYHAPISSNHLDLLFRPPRV
jgi:hypothetical protein